MTTEAKAKERIDHKLVAAGWLVQDLKQLNLGASMGVVVRVIEAQRGEPTSVLLAHIRAQWAGQPKPREPNQGKEVA